MKKKLLLLIAIIPNLLLAQSQKQLTELVIYNTTFDAISTGIGTVINKPKNEKIGKAFIRGFKNGLLASTFTLSGKLATNLITSQKDFSYGWLSRGLHSVGTSIITNSIQNKKVFSNFYFELGFIRFTAGKQFRIQLLPHSLIEFAILSRKGTIDIENSLKYSSILIRQKQSLNNITEYAAFTAGNIVVYDNNQYQNSLYQHLAHENIHILQQQEYSTLNHYFYKYSLKVPRISRWIYLDFPTSDGFYQMIGGVQKPEFKNFYEFEAQYYSTFKQVQR